VTVEFLPWLGAIALLTVGGAFVHGAAGFGFAMIFMPIASQLVGIQSAAGYLSIVGSATTLQLLYYNRAAVNWAEVRRLVLGALPGLACGLTLLRFGEPDILKKVLGAGISSYAIFGLFIEPRLLPPDLPPLPFKRHPLGLLAGFLGGFFGGAIGVNGAPVVVYASIRRWPKDCFKSIIQGFLVTTNALALTGYAATGIITRSVLTTGLVLLPVGLIAATLGHAAATRLSPETFRKLALSLILAMGALLIMR